MSDSTTEGNEKKKKIEKLTGSRFFTFAVPYMEFIGKGKFFSLIYIVMAVINPIIPFVILYQVIDSGFFSYGAKYVFAFILAWFVIVFAFWIGFQIWWNRRKKVTNTAPCEFVITMFFSELLQTTGEWLGTIIGIIGAGGGLLAAIFLGSDVDYLFQMIGMGFLRFGVLVVIIGPIIGFFTIVISRFLAEQLRLWVTLTNNTKEIADNIKK